MLTTPHSQSEQHNTVVHSSTGKEVGEINNGCLQKHVRFTRHLYRKFDGWTWDLAIIDKAASLGVTTILVIDDEKHQEYRVSMDVFRKNAKPIEHKNHGKQLCLPRNFWEVSDTPKQPKKSKLKH